MLSLASSRRSLDTKLREIKAEPDSEAKSEAKSVNNILLSNQNRSEKKELSEVKEPVEGHAASQRKAMSERK